MDYSELSDSDLIVNLRAGEEGILEYLLEKYKFLVKNEAKKLFILGGDNDDLIQEGMIGLFKAVQNYKLKDGEFYSFARLCINRHMYTAIKASKRQKHMPLNTYMSIEYDDYLVEKTKVAVGDSDPESLYLYQEYSEDFTKELLSLLSDLEKEVLLKHISGLHYKEIAQLMSKEPKTIDNTLQRIKNKVKKILKKL